MDTESTSRRDPEPRWSFALLLALGLLAFFYQLGTRDMWGRLETEAAVCAGNMLATGEFAIPVLMEKPFVDNRPPGAFWLVAGSFALTGARDEWAARLPSALAALLTVLLVYAMGRKAGGPTAGVISALVLLGMVSFVWIGRASQQDMLLTLFVTAAWWAFWGTLDSRSGASAFGYALAFQAALGCGALVKGPAIVLSLLPILLYVAYARRWRDVTWRALLLTLPIGLAMGASWYLQVWFQYPEFRETLVERFTNQKSIHGAPWYDYLVRLPGLLGPALFLLPFGFLAWRRADAAQRRGPLGLFAIGFVAQLVIFSLFPSKRTHYLLPALPLLASALGIAMARWRFEERRALARMGVVLAVASPVLIAGCLVAVWWLAANVPVPTSGSLLRAAGVTAALSSFAVWIVLSYRRGHRRGTWRLGWICWLLGIVCLMGDLAPALDASLSQRRLAAGIRERVPPGARLASLSGHAGLSYYSLHSVRRMKLSGAPAFLAEPDHYLITLGEAIEVVSPDRFRVVWSYAPEYRREPAYLVRGGPVHVVVNSPALRPRRGHLRSRTPARR